MDNTGDEAKKEVLLHLEGHAETGGGTQQQHEREAKREERETQMQITLKVQCEHTESQSEPA